jgi:hypothetical protein
MTSSYYDEPKPRFDGPGYDDWPGVAPFDPHDVDFDTGDYQPPGPIPPNIHY